MRANRIVRVILGLLCLAIFLGYAYIHASHSPMSGDIQGPDWEEYLRINYGLRPDGTPIDPQPESAAPAPAAEPAAAPEAAAPQEASALEAAAVPEALPEQEPAEELIPEATVDPNSPYGIALITTASYGLPVPPAVDVGSWELTLVNGDHSIGQYEPEQLAYLNQTASETDIQYSQNGYRCPVDVRIADALLAMAVGCRDAGLPVFLSSGYRSYTEQVANFQRVCQNNGVTDGKDANGHYITMPAGCSEHQLALCCDITDVYHEIKNAEIEKTQTFQWLKEHCAEYGFVHRFPAGKEDITGVMYEPFHFRYVGLEAARYMTDNNLCLEEFLALYGVE